MDVAFVSAYTVYSNLCIRNYAKIRVLPRQTTQHTLKTLPASTDIFLRIFLQTVETISREAPGKIAIPIIQSYTVC